MDRNSGLGHTICGQLDGEQPKVRVAAFNIVVSINMFQRME